MPEFNFRNYSEAFRKLNYIHVQFEAVVSVTELPAEIIKQLVCIMATLLPVLNNISRILRHVLRVGGQRAPEINRGSYAVNKERQMCLSVAQFHSHRIYTCLTTSGTLNVDVQQCIYIYIY